jgi:hypothetical protein
MIIPKIKTDEFNIGDKLINLVDINCGYCVVTTGEVFIVEDIEYIDNSLGDNYVSTYILKHGDIITKEYKSYVIQNFTLKTDLKTAKKLYDEKVLKIHLINFIEKNCKHKTTGIDHYDTYDMCKINARNYCMSACGVCLECLKYFDKNEYEKDEIVKNYIRTNKIKKLNE